MTSIFSMVFALVSVFATAFNFEFLSNWLLASLLLVVLAIILPVMVLTRLELRRLYGYYDRRKQVRFYVAADANAPEQQVCGDISDFLNKNHLVYLYVGMPEFSEEDGAWANRYLSEDREYFEPLRTMADCRAFGIDPELVAHLKPEDGAVEVFPNIL